MARHNLLACFTAVIVCVLVWTSRVAFAGPLEICHLVVQLGRLGVKPRANVPEACQSKLGYACSEYPRILAKPIKNRPHWRLPCVGNSEPAQLQPGVKTGAGE